MDDRALVAAMVAGDPRGLDGAYRRYAPRLYAYSRSLVRDGEVAADVVQDTFVVAGQRAGQLRDPDRLLAWLYAIARHESLRQLRARRRETAADLEEPFADTVDLTAGVQAAQVRELVHAAAAGLGEGDREVVDLALRHDLAVADLAAVLGVSVDHAHARMSRARAALARALGVLLVARAATCPGVRDLLPGWNGRLDPLLRKRLGRHVDGCARCTASRSALLSPAALLGAYTAGPFAAAAVVASPSGPPPELPLDAETGFPVVGRRGRWAIAGTAAGIVVVAVLVVALAPRDDKGGPVPVAVRSPSSAASGPPPVATTPGQPPPTAPLATAPAEPPLVAPSAAPRTTAGFTGPTGAEPSPVIPSVPPAPFSVSVSGGVVCAPDGLSYRLSAVATGTARLSAATLFWRSTASGVESKPMSRLASSARAARAGLRFPSIEWWVTATAADGTTAATAHRTALNPCP